ncbi:multicopper oxidase domain-containing protein [Streptomyces sp. NPDC002566]|uniref:multicopper oxidase domain-containing protein n=1 Tax=Streptomyces sp. NPDC002566 TaxID=3364650 RepID=UPI0036A698E0
MPPTPVTATSKRSPTTELRLDLVQVGADQGCSPRQSATAPWRLIRGVPFDPARSDVTTRVGDIEVGRPIADLRHPVHLHLVGFRVLWRSGKKPVPHDAGLKDTVSSPRRSGGDVAAATSSTVTTPSARTGMIANLDVVEDVPAGTGGSPRPPAPQDAEPATGSDREFLPVEVRNSSLVRSLPARQYFLRKRS